MKKKETKKSYGTYSPKKEKQQKQKGNKPIVLHKSHSGEVEPMENVVTYIGIGFIS